MKIIVLTGKDKMVASYLMTKKECDAVMLILDTKF